MRLVELSANLLGDDALLAELLEVLQYYFLGRLEHLIWHVLVQDFELGGLWHFLTSYN